MAGHNKIRMTDLSAMFRKKGFRDAETFIQSGNVIFTGGDESGSNLVQEIESAIRDRFGLEITAMIRTPDEIRKIISDNPFPENKNYDQSKAAVIFLQEGLDDKGPEKLKGIDYPPDKFEVIGREIYIYCPNGFGRTKLYTNFFEGKLKVKGTARNWNTINTVLAIAEKKQLQV